MEATAWHLPGMQLLPSSFLRMALQPGELPLRGEPFLLGPALLRPLRQPWLATCLQCRPSCVQPLVILAQWELVQERIVLRLEVIPTGQVTQLG